jgi:site-specific DNA recombinase
MTQPVAAAIYCRISNDPDGTALGVGRQQEDCEALAGRLGWPVAEVYTDNDYSAYEGRKKRPGYRRMLADLADGRRDALIAYHSDRLTRRPRELEEVIEVLQAAKAPLRFVQSDVDITNGDGLMMLRIQGAFAAQESATKSRRVARKWEAKANTGEPHIGGPRPFGFENDRKTHRPVEAQAIRDVAARYLAGESLRSLCVWLDDQGVPTAQGHAWRTPTLGDVLRAPRMAGLRTRHDQIVGPGAWEPILPIEQWRQIQDLMTKRKYTGERTVRTYLLTGLLRCGKCGTQLYAAPRGQERRYACVSGPDHRGCGGLTVTATPVDDLISRAVLMRLDGPRLNAAMAGRATDTAAASQLSQQIADDQAKLQELAAECSRPDGPSVAEWRTAREPINRRIETNQRKLQALSNSEALHALGNIGPDLASQWEGLDITRQHAIIKAVLDHAVVNPSPPSPVFRPSRVDPHWRL